MYSYQHRCKTFPTRLQNLNGRITAKHILDGLKAQRDSKHDHRRVVPGYSRDNELQIAQEDFEEENHPAGAIAMIPYQRIVLIDLLFEADMTAVVCCGRAGVFEPSTRACGELIYQVNCRNILGICDI